MEYRTAVSLGGIITLTLVCIVLFANAEGNTAHLDQEVTHQIMDHILMFFAGALVGVGVDRLIKKATSRR
jgi:zinc transporter ZupT